MPSRTPPQTRAPLQWDWPASPSLRRGRSTYIADKLHLNESSWRYVNTFDGHVAVWSTAKLHRGGDYGVWLLDAEDNVIDRMYAPVKDDCRAQAKIWMAVHSPSYVSHVIEEEP